MWDSAVSLTTLWCLRVPNIPSDPDTDFLLGHHSAFCIFKLGAMRRNTGKDGEWVALWRVQAWSVPRVMHAAVDHCVSLDIEVL
ncbi:hypothetical protein BDD12DRAFT_823747 [Trichophaea hybrida]|nr:hypothetical protein BDD12DRAFT_823747 [Trichophaea hybrida]